MEIIKRKYHIQLLYRKQMGGGGETTKTQNFYNFDKEKVKLWS